MNSHTEAPKNSQEQKAQNEANLVQLKLRDAIERMHTAVDRAKFIEATSIACAYLSGAPRGYHAEIELIPVQQRHLGEIAKFLTIEPLKTAIRRYVIVEKAVGDSFLSVSPSSAEGQAGFVVREIRGGQIGFEKKYNAFDLSSARVIPDTLTPQLATVSNII